MAAPAMSWGLQRVSEGGAVDLASKDNGSLAVDRTQQGLPKKKRRHPGESRDPRTPRHRPEPRWQVSATAIPVL
jgi:hypothetical protein